MDYFEYQHGELYAEQASVREIAAEVGTPAYIYSTRTILHHFNRLRQAFAEANPLICYAVKANYSLAVCRLLRQAGAGFDVDSGGELFRALKAGGDPKTIVYPGVGRGFDFRPPNVRTFADDLAAKDLAVRAARFMRAQLKPWSKDERHSKR